MTNTEKPFVFKGFSRFAADRMSDSRNALTRAELCDQARHAEAVCETAGDGIRTHDVQLGKLAFYH